MEKLVTVWRMSETAEAVSNHDLYKQLYRERDPFTYDVDLWFRTKNQKGKELKRHLGGEGHLVPG